MGKTIIVKTPLETFCVTGEYSPERVWSQIESRVPAFEDAYVTYCSKCVHESDVDALPDGATLRVAYRLFGGKGGFGNLMKNQAAKLKKQMNFDASRDLQGRRIRNVQYEQKLVEYLKKKKREEEEVKRANDEYKKVEQTIRSGGISDKVDQKYKEKLDRIEQSMSECIREGLNAQKLKRRNEDANGDDAHQKEGDEAENALVKKVRVAENADGEKNVTPVEAPKPAASEGVEAANGKQESNTTTVADTNNTTSNSSSNGNHNNENNTTGNAEGETAPAQSFPAIDLNIYNSVEALLGATGADHLRAELIRLGLKCGGKPIERAQRLWAIKIDPTNLFNPKFLAKPAAK